MCANDEVQYQTLILLYVSIKNRHTERKMHMPVNTDLVSGMWQYSWREVHKHLLTTGRKPMTNPSMNTTYTSPAQDQDNQCASMDLGGCTWAPTLNWGAMNSWWLWRGSSFSLNICLLRGAVERKQETWVAHNLANLSIYYEEFSKSDCHEVSYEVTGPLGDCVHE